MAPSSLLDLPGECRNLIYDHLFADTSEGVKISRRPKGHPPGTYAAIEKACRQLRQETYSFCHQSIKIRYRDLAAFIGIFLNKGTTSVEELKVQVLYQDFWRDETIDMLPIIRERNLSNASSRFVFRLSHVEGRPDRYLHRPTHYPNGTSPAIPNPLWDTYHDRYTTVVALGQFVQHNNQAWLFFLKHADAVRVNLAPRSIEIVLKKQRISWVDLSVEGAEDESLMGVRLHGTYNFWNFRVLWA